MNDFKRYDPVTNIWDDITTTTTGLLPLRLMNFGMTSTKNGYIFVFGGNQGGKAISFLKLSGS